ncbi:MAG: hypothetical protein AAGF95_06005 [Chloroflexota bacterium]
MNVDFISAVCEEFCEALSEVVSFEDINPQECWDPLIQVLGKDIDSDTLVHITKEQIEELRLVFSSWFENNNITTDHIQVGIKRTLSRWPPKQET